MKHHRNKPRTPKYTGRRSVNERQDVRPVSYSYHNSRKPAGAKSGRNESASELVKNRSSTSHWRLFVALIIVIAILILELPVSSNAKIVVVAGSKASTGLPVTSYQVAVEHIFSNSLVDHTKLTVDSGALTAKLKQQFPEIKNASVGFSAFSWRPTVTLHFSEPVLVLVSSQGNYLVGASGGVIGRAAKNTNLPLVTDGSNLNPTPGQAILPSNYVSFISQLLAQLSASSLKVSQLNLPRQSAELDVRITGQSYYGKFNLEGDPLEQVGTFLAAKNYLAKQNIGVSQYIDARLPGRAYYQ